MGEPQQSKFRKLDMEESLRKGEERLSEEEFKNNFKLTQDARETNKKITNTLGSAFKEHYGEKKLKGSELQITARAKVDELFKEKYIGRNAEKNRGDHAKKQIKLQRRLLEEQKLYRDRQQEELNFQRECVPSYDLEHYKERFKTDREKDAFSHWAVEQVKNEKTGEIENEEHFLPLVSNNDQIYADEMKRIVLRLPKLIHSGDFSFNNDREFVSRYAEKYDLLCKGASAEVFIERLEKLMDDDELDWKVSLVEAKAVAELCKDLKKEYEERMELIRSPYYALLTSQDLEPYLGNDYKDKLKNDLKGKKPDFVAYVERYRKLKNSAYGKRKNINAIYRQKLQHFQEEKRDSDLEKVRKLDLKEQGSPQETLDAYYQQELQKEQQALEKTSNADFLKNARLRIYVKIHHMEINDFEQLEQLFLEIQEKGTVNGVAVQKEHREEIEKDFNDLIAQRKEAYSMSLASGKAESILNGKAADLKNSAFTATEEGKLLQKLQDCEWVSKTEESEEKCKNYLNGVFLLTQKIMELGYKISPKYEDRLSQPEYIEEGLEAKRDRYEKSYYEKNSIPEEHRKERIELPTVSVNGKEISTYNMGSLLNFFAGGKFRIEGDKAAEAERLFGILSELDRKRATVSGLYLLDEGIKSLVGEVYETKYVKEVIQYENQLISLLFDDVQKIRLYLRNHPELKSRPELAELYQKLDKQHEEEPEQELLDLAVLNAKSIQGEKSKEKEFKDKEFSKEDAQKYIEQMNKIKIDAIKGDTVLELMRNMPANMNVCQQVNELRHQIARALTHGVKIDDATLISFRAKFMYFEMAQRSMLLIQEDLLGQDRETRSEWDEDEWAERLNGMKLGDHFPGIPAFIPGQQQDVFNTIVNKFQNEYADREKTIRKTMLVFKDTTAGSGEIKKRAADYCKNSLISEYMSASERIGIGTSINVIRAWCLETGREPKDITRLQRTFLDGKAPKDVIRLYRMFTGTTEQKYAAYLELGREMEAFDLNDFKYTGEASMIDNYRRKTYLTHLHINGRMVGGEIKTLLGDGYEESPEEEKSTEDMIRRLDILEDHACFYETSRTSALEGIDQTKFRGALSLEDFANINETQKAWLLSLDEMYENHHLYKIDSEVIDDDEAKELQSVIGKFLKTICPDLEYHPLTEKQIAANKKAQKEKKPPVYLQKAGIIKEDPLLNYRAQEVKYEKKYAQKRKDDLKAARVPQQERLRKQEEKKAAEERKIEALFADEDLMAKTLEKRRKGYQNKYYEEHPLQEGEKKKKKLLPHMQINGEVFYTYNVGNNLISLFQFRKINFTGDNAQEVKKLFSECSEILKKMAALEDINLGVKGIREDAAEAYNRKLDEQLMDAEVRLVQLLHDTDAVKEQIREYLKNHPMIAEKANIVEENKEAEKEEEKKEEKEQSKKKEVDQVKEQREKKEVNQAKEQLPPFVPDMKFRTKKERSRIAKSWKNPFDTVRTAQLSQLSKHISKDLNECSNADFALLSSMMTENEQENKKLVGLYLGKKGSTKAEEQPNITGAMDMMMQKIMNIKLADFNLNDEEIAKAPQMLERLCLNLSGFNSFLEKYPDYYEGKDEETIERIETKLDQLSSIATYYQTRKGILSDPLYARLDVKQMTMDPTALKTEAESAFARKLLESEIMAKRMLEKNNVDAKIIEARKLPKFKNEDNAEALIAELEEYNDELIGETYLSHTDKKEIEKYRKLAFEPVQQKKEEKKKEEKKKPPVTEKKEEKKKEEKKKGKKEEKKATAEKPVLNWDLDDTVDHDKLLNSMIPPTAQLEEMTQEEYNETMAFSTRPCNARDFTLEEKKVQEKVLEDLGYAGAAKTKILFDIFKNRLVYEGYRTYKRYYKEDGTLSRDVVWTEEAKKKPELIKAFNFLQDYYKAHDLGIPKPGEVKPLDKQEYPSTYNMLTLPAKELKSMQMKYEEQDTMNCWACSGTAILNHYLMKKNKNPKLTTQFDMRGYVPKYKDFKDVKETVGSKNLFNGYVNETKKYIGTGKTGVGNVFEVGDFILDRAPGAMIHRLMLQVDEPYNSSKISAEEKKEKDTIHDNQKRIFMKQVHSCIQSGHPVSILNKSLCGGARHYVTIVGIGYDKNKKTDVIKYLDSMQGKENKGKGPMPVQTATVDEVMEKMNGGQQIELTWITDMEKDEELKKNFSNLRTDQNGEYYEAEKTMEAALNVMNTKGVTVSKYPSEMPDGYRNVNYTVYMPKKQAV